MGGGCIHCGITLTVHELERNEVRLELPYKLWSFPCKYWQKIHNAQLGCHPELWPHMPTMPAVCCPRQCIPPDIYPRDTHSTKPHRHSLKIKPLEKSVQKTKPRETLLSPQKKHNSRILECKDEEIDDAWTWMENNDQRITPKHAETSYWDKDPYGQVQHGWIGMVILT